MERSKEGKEVDAMLNAWEDVLLKAKTCPVCKRTLDNILREVEAIVAHHETVK